MTYHTAGQMIELMQISISILKAPPYNQAHGLRELVWRSARILSLSTRIDTRVVKTMHYYLSLFYKFLYLGKYQ